MRGLAKSATWPELTIEVRKISLDAEVSAVNQAVADYMRAIDVELVRLHPLMARAMKGISLGPSRISARVTPIRASIVGPPDSATRRQTSFINNAIAAGRDF